MTSPEGGPTDEARTCDKLSLDCLILGGLRAALEHVALTGVRRKLRSRLECRLRLVVAAHSFQEVAANRRQQVIIPQLGGPRELVGDRKSRRGALGHTDRDRAVELDHGRTYQGRKPRI